ncbi:MAG: redoxin domain-containing protein [Candidatus Eisenbacteria bacterium]|nr:redoxin domain-containing protein [Candidatus Eisenbacteria bacterium]
MILPGQRPRVCRFADPCASATRRGRAFLPPAGSVILPPRSEVPEWRGEDLVMQGRRMVGLVVALISLGACLWPARAVGSAGGGGEGPADDPLVGRPAPAFLLSTIDGATQVSSDTLYEFSTVTMLVFWTTHCAECTRRLEVCQELADWGEIDGLQVIGINFDEQPSGRIRILARQTTPRVTHLYDPGARVSSRFGAAAHSFTLFLVDTRGVVRQAWHDPSVETLLAMRPYLTELIEEAFADAGGAEDPSGGGEASARGADLDRAVRTDLLAELGLRKQQKLSVHGRGRVRWMHIDTTSTCRDKPCVGATGAYGEPLQPGAFLHHRLELELAYAISPRLTAGGLVWLSNEGTGVLRSGPAYLSNEMGSIFIRYDMRADLPLLGRSEASLRGGYYDVAWTPLTMMRWDSDDTPISGGQRSSGCGVCGGEAGMAGFIRLESVETLGEELTFEGARLDLALGDRLSLTGLYARPHTRYPTRDERWRCCTAEFDPDDAYYLQQIYAGRATAHLSVPWSPDLAELSATTVLTREDEENTPCVISCMGSDPFSDHLLAGDLTLPLPKRTQLYAEAAGSWWRPDLSDEDADALTGSALRAGLTFDIRPADALRPLGLPLGAMMTRLDLCYQRLSEDFYSAYNALSYEANLQGPRISLRTDWGRFGLGAFFKHQEPVVVPASVADAEWKKSTASVWVDGLLWRGGTLMVGGVIDDRDLPGAEYGAEKQEILILSFVQELAPRCSLILEGQRLDGRREENDEEYSSTTLRTMLDVAF